MVTGGGEQQLCLYLLPVCPELVLGCHPAPLPIPEPILRGRDPTRRKMTSKIKIGDESPTRRPVGRPGGCAVVLTPH